MVPIRTTSRPGGLPTHRLTFYAALAAALALTGVYLTSLRGGSDGGSDDAEIPASGEVVSPLTALNQNQALSSAANAKSKEELDEEDVDPMSITLGFVNYDGDTALPYYHCGPSHVDNPELTELVLLHGAAFTKEDWKTSGILGMLCDINNEEDEGNLSVTALDLPVKVGGEMLAAAFNALVGRKVLSGRPVTIVSPSASGKAVVGLGKMASEGSGELVRIVKGWIPVASGAVVSSSEPPLLAFKTANIPILAIHGDKDAGGKRVTERLEKLNGARGVELEGRHPVYLDSPEEFVQEVMQFLDEESL
ncbi:hypothetical protein ACHAWF_006807 [Thalassiosira exigua]